MLLLMSRNYADLYDVWNDQIVEKPFCTLLASDASINSDCMWLIQLKAQTCRIYLQESEIPCITNAEDWFLRRIFWRLNIVYNEYLLQCGHFTQSGKQEPQSVSRKRYYVNE